MTLLTRSTLGRLVAYAASPESGVTVAFNTSHWGDNGPGSLSLSSGALRYTNAGSDGDVNIRELAASGFGAGYVQIVTSEMSGGAGIGIGPAFGLSVAAPTSESFLVMRGTSLGVATAGLVERIAGSTVQTDLTSQAAWTLPARQSLSVIGTDAEGYDFNSALSATLAGLTISTDFAGWWKGGGAIGATRTISFYARMNSRYLTVTGLPSGYTVRILSAADATLASAVESGGVATVDMLAVALPNARKVSVLDGALSPVITEVPVEAVWGGDVWVYLASPSTPANLVVDNPTPTTLDVSWDASPTADTYTVHRSLDGVSGWTSVYTGTSLGFTDTGLSPLTTYYYRVLASNAAGSSPWSSNASNTTTALAPVVNSISPDTGVPSGGTEYVLTGLNFLPGAAVFFDEVEDTTAVWINSTTITGVTPPFLFGTGAVDVTVVNPDLQEHTLVDGFIYAYVLPDQLSPVSTALRLPPTRSVEDADKNVRDLVTFIDRILPYIPLVAEKASTQTMLLVRQTNGTWKQYFLAVGPGLSLNIDNTNQTITILLDP